MSVVDQIFKKNKKYQEREGSYCIYAFLNYRDINDKDFLANLIGKCVYSFDEVYDYEDEHLCPCCSKNMLGPRIIIKFNKELGGVLEYSYQNQFFQKNLETNQKISKFILRIGEYYEWSD